jgi:hypothetical protein
VGGESKFITFVLGAGSSREVEMPTGTELKYAIAASMPSALDGFGLLAGGANELRDAMNRIARASEVADASQRYLAAANRIRSAMPQAASIDNFLDSNRSSRDIAEVGKLAIAYEILNAERKSLLFGKSGSIEGIPSFEKTKDTWFAEFFQLVSMNAQVDEIRERLSRVRVVTFNYDRTLEHYLYHALQDYYGITAKDAAELLSYLIVIHPYGQVGKLPWQRADSTVPFGATSAASDLIEVAKDLKTFAEGTSVQASDIEQIRASIADAATLVFLGFAYHEMNLRLLFGNEGDTAGQHDKRIFGTAKGLSESNKRIVASELSRLTRIDERQITLRRELASAELLPEYSRSLKVPA